MDLIRTFSDETYRRALEDWSWLDLTDTVPLCASPFGDVFFQSRDGIVYLDMLEGRGEHPLRRRLHDAGGAGV